MTITEDLREWFKVWQETPMKSQAVQTRERKASDRRYGRISSLTETEAVVIGHGWDNTPAEKFVWRGTRAEYDATWRID